jgi:mRNA interferase RelE/StbE
MQTIVYVPSAAKELDKLPFDVAQRIERALSDYAVHRTGDVKALTGSLAIRLRIGDYRVIFDEASTHLLVLALGNRRDIYR